MDFKHFSHPHNLTLHQIPQGQTINCSGCNLPGSGTVYACFQCKFFLHEQCFNATRSMAHPSHTLHPLTLVPYPTYPSGSFLCNSCSQPGSGFSFTCSVCEFDLHVHCAFISENTPSQQIHHKSHPKHALNLLPKPPYAGGEFICSGCGGEGSDYVYNCSACEFDLHPKCASLNETAKREDHEHPLSLYYELGQGRGPFECDVCHRRIPKDSWIYACFDCDYEIHVKCVLGKARPKHEVELEKIQELSKLQMQMQMTRIRAQTVSSAINGMRF